jgi:hypothetical protein
MNVGTPYLAFIVAADLPLTAAAAHDNCLLAIAGAAAISPLAAPPGIEKILWRASERAPIRLRPHVASVVLTSPKRQAAAPAVVRVVIVSKAIGNVTVKPPNIC